MLQQLPLALIANGRLTPALMQLRDPEQAPASQWGGVTNNAAQLK
jgi:hypothetical protein